MMRCVNKKMKFLSLCLMFCLCSVFAFGQNHVSKFSSMASSDSADKELNFIPDAQVAMSRTDYPVTAGDIYTLAFSAGTNPVTYSIPLDSSYKLRIANLGVINAKGLTFLELKDQVIKIVQKNYPMGGVQFVLTAPAVFTVEITGEVHKTAEKKVWALVRLSSFIGDNYTDYSSLRKITVQSDDGSSKVYDLFKASRYGDLTQDPFLRPGDRIVVTKMERKVSVNGAVKRPGVYELLDGENLKSLIDLYGDGFTPFSDLSRIELTRVLNDKDSYGEKIYLNKEDYEKDFNLICYDSVTVSSLKDLSLHIFVEGAVLDSALKTGTTLNASKKLSFSFSEGEDYAFFIRNNKDILTEVSDLENVYIIRDGEKIAMKNNDTLLIPFKQFFVSVSGAVYQPGRYPYIPDRTWDYYIGLAGGFIKEKNAGNAIVITDVNGKKYKKSEFIKPEMTIEAKSNSRLYYFNQYAPIVTTILSAVSTSISILAVTGVIN